ncbi:MAG: hypothetical protein WBA67_05670 [Jannaschia sp.]
MTRFTILTAATLAMTAPAFAYTGVSPTMVTAVETILAENGINDVVLSSLSDEQVVELYAAGQSDDGQELTKIRAVLNDEGVSRTITEQRMTMTEADERGLMPAGEDSVTMSVQNFLDRRSMTVDASTLTDAQVAELYFLAFSGDTEATDAEIEAILSM